MQTIGHQHESARAQPTGCHGAQQQLGARIVAAHERSRTQRVAAESGDHIGQPIRRVGMAGAVLGVAVEGKVREHEPKAVGQLFHHGLELAVAEPGRVQQRDRRARAGLAVGDARAVGMVVEPQFHPLRRPAASPRSKAGRRAGGGPSRPTVCSSRRCSSRPTPLVRWAPRRAAAIR